MGQISRLLPLLLAAPALSGCVAVAALPVLAGGAMFAGGNVKIRAATPRPKPSGTVRMAGVAEERTAGAAVTALPAVRRALDTSAGGGNKVVLTGLTELPPPTPTTPDPWRMFLDYAAERGAKLASSEGGRSVLLEPGSPLDLPRMRPCEHKPPAVLIDLDSGLQPFAMAQPHTASPDLIGGLARLRDAGVVVLWITALPAADVGPVAEALKSSGLDPAGSDPLLLIRNREDRKQVLREDAARDVCVIAIAGDRKSDFDELFDYLRDPSSGQSFDFLVGSGWFLVPPPL